MSFVQRSLTKLDNTLVRHWKTTKCNHGYWRRWPLHWVGVATRQKASSFHPLPVIPSHQRTTTSYCSSPPQRCRRIDSSLCINTPSFCVASCSEWRKIGRERWTKNDEWLTIWRAIRLTDCSVFAFPYRRCTSCTPSAVFPCRGPAPSYVTYGARTTQFHKIVTCRHFCKRNESVICGSHLIIIITTIILCSLLCAKNSSAVNIMNWKVDMKYNKTILK